MDQNKAAGKIEESTGAAALSPPAAQRQPHAGTSHDHDVLEVDVSVRSSQEQSRIGDSLM